MGGPQDTSDRPIVRTGFILLLADVFVLFSIDLRRGGGGDREDFVLHEPESDGSGAALA